MVRCRSGRTRRRFLQGSLTLAGLGLLSGCGIPFGPAAQPARLHRIGVLSNGTATAQAPSLAALRQGLEELGYVEGQSIAFELRYTEGWAERLPELAAELVRLDVDVILAGGSVAVRAAGHATTTIPIVFNGTGDPVAEGLVRSLARPGGNITGLTLTAGEEFAKRLQLLTEAVPGLTRVAVLWNLGSDFREIEAAAPVLGVQVLSLELRAPDELDTVLDTATTGRADGLLVGGGAVFGALAPRIVEWAARHGLPAMYSNTPFIDAGGLMIYAANSPQNYRRAATYVDKILKGTKPADIPVERPMVFDFVLNRKTADALGLTIPESIRQQVTKVIQ